MGPKNKNIEGVELPPPPEQPIEVPVVCPTCEGLGMLEHVDLEAQKKLGLDLNNKEMARVRSILETTKQQRDGWRRIGEALINTAFDYKMAGFTDTPPAEVLEAMAGDESAVSVLRDVIIGRAWRVQGKLGKNTCDYPLCENRDKIKYPGHGPTTTKIEIGAVGTQAVLNVCIPHPDRQECHAWGQWIRARAMRGRIEIR